MRFLDEEKLIEAVHLVELYDEWIEARSNMIGRGRPTFQEFIGWVRLEIHKAHGGDDD